MLYFRAVLVLLFGCLIFTEATHASTYVNVEDTVVYLILARLESEGIITSGMLNTKPISRKEAFRLLHEAETNYQTRNEFTKSLVRSLKDRLGPEPDGMQIKPLDKIYASYIHTNSDNHVLHYNKALENEQPLNHNNNGDIYERGDNERFGFTSRLENWGPFSVSFHPEFRYPESFYTGYPNTVYANDEFTIKKAYAVLDMGWDLVIGKDSQWWGPGYNASLLLSNNAEPFTMLKLTNPDPVHLPWILDGLGPFKFTFLVANPENVGTVSRPYFYGMRFDFKPHPNFEMAIHKTALIGGRGRQLNYHDWINSILPFSDAENRSNQAGGDPGDQRAGLDFKLTIPSPVQPFQIYGEADGEDEYHNLPNLWAFLAGVYLPRLFEADRLDLRIEFETTRGRRNSPYIWYVHHIYTSYTYNGNVIGDYMGTDSENFFSEISYLLPEKNGRIFAHYDREQHNLYVPGEHEKLDAVGIGTFLSLTQTIDVTVSYDFGIWKNIGNVAGARRNVNLFKSGVSYRF